MSKRQVGGESQASGRGLGGIERFWSNQFGYQW